MNLKSLLDVVINSYKGTKSAPQIVSVSFRGVRAEVLLHALEDKNIYVPQVQLVLLTSRA